MKQFKGNCGNEFTTAVINSIGPKASPRIRKVVGSLIQYLHDFARENEITVSEWMAAVEMMNLAGQMSNERRNESQLICDILGIESLVDDITHSVLTGASNKATKTAILGPFYRVDTPPTPNDSSIIRSMPNDGEVVYMHGIVSDADSGAPIEGVLVDVWQCSTNGLYEQQDPEQAEWNLRGKLTTDSRGYYGHYCLRPVPYPIPYDGPAGKLLQLLDKHPWRPGHIHILFKTTCKGYTSLTTQVFDKSSKYLVDDVVFAVKTDLVVEFKPLVNNKRATLELVYDIKLTKISHED